MNDIRTILIPDSIDAGISVSNKKALFQQLGTMAERTTGVPARQVVAAISERERLGTTGFGGGVAIPHGKIEGLDQVVGCFARLTAPVDFEAVDRLPIDLVFLLLSPPDAGAEHLKALASVSRLFRDRQLVAKLRGARSRDAIFALLAGVEALDHA